MRRLLTIGFVFVFASSVSLFGQGRRNTYGSANGWGSVAFPGTGHAPGVNPNPRPLGSNASAVTAGRGGYGGYGGYRNQGRSRYVGIPVYVGGFYGGYSGYDSPAQQEPANVTVINNVPPTPAAPPVIINQYFGAQPTGEPEQEPSHVQIYSHTPQTSNTPETSEPRSYLIAYKDHSVYSALAYWVEDRTLHYVTTANTHNQADLNLIDLEFTKKLNQDRNMPFNAGTP